MRHRPYTRDRAQANGSPFAPTVERISSGSIPDRPQEIVPPHPSLIEAALAPALRCLNRNFLAFMLLTLLLFSACSPPGGNSNATPTRQTLKATATPTASGSTANDACPLQPRGISLCFTPRAMRVAYGVESLFERGFTGKGQTVVDIVSFGSPTLQQDMDVFDTQFGLPPITIKVVSPLGPNPPGGTHGWNAETTLDVQIIHAIAPEAGIVVLTSPVNETEGTIGLPEFRKLEQYAIDNHLGNIISQSWGASEVTLKDQAGQQEIKEWDALFQHATTQQGLTFFSASGDNGATDYADLQSKTLSPTPTTSFPADDPWVTVVGGTRLTQVGGNISESAWNNDGGASGGGFSSFFPEPAYQQILPSSVQSLMKMRRGVPDVAADADPSTGLAFYLNGNWFIAGGTSASTPVWAAIGSIADQMAGHPLGFINTALYKLAQSSHYAQDFRDITSGNNDVNWKHVQLAGYAAVQGWDPVTGFGAPIAEKLLPDLIAALKG